MPFGWLTLVLPRIDVASSRTGPAERLLQGTRWHLDTTRRPTSDPPHSCLGSRPMVKWFCACVTSSSHHINFSGFGSARNTAGQRHWPDYLT